MLRIHAVGGFQVEVDGRERTSPTLDRATALLAWLALWPLVVTLWASIASEHGSFAAFAEFARRPDQRRRARGGDGGIRKELAAGVRRF
jgi:hypothetical protein